MFEINAATYYVGEKHDLDFQNEVLDRRLRIIDYFIIDYSLINLPFWYLFQESYIEKEDRIIFLYQRLSYEFSARNHTMYSKLFNKVCTSISANEYIY